MSQTGYMAGPTFHNELIKGEEKESLSIITDSSTLNNEHYFF